MQRGLDYLLYHVLLYQSHRASESSATHRSKTRVCKQDWDSQENQDVMNVEDQETEDESNQILDVAIGVVQLD